MTERERFEAIPPLERKWLLIKSRNPNFAHEMTAWERKVALMECERIAASGEISRNDNFPYYAYVRQKPLKKQKIKQQKEKETECLPQ